MVFFCFSNASMRPGRAAGVTLVELVLAIVILGLVVPILLALGSSVAFRFYQAEVRARAAQLAHRLESTVISRRFDELLQKSGGSWSATLGPESGEISASYDDVDDFHGFSETLTGGLAGYTLSVSVTYAATDMVNRVIAASGSAGNDYKLITVRVVGPLGVDVSYDVLATTANSQGAPAQ